MREWGDINEISGFDDVITMMRRRKIYVVSTLLVLMVLGAVVHVRNGRWRVEGQDELSVDTDTGGKSLGSYGPWSNGEDLTTLEAEDKSVFAGTEDKGGEGLIQSPPVSGGRYEDGSQGREMTRDLVIAGIKKDDVGWLDSEALRDFTKLVYRVDEPVEGRRVPANKVSGLLLRRDVALFSLLLGKRVGPL